MAIQLRSAALRVAFITCMSVVGSDNTLIALKPTQDTSSFPIMPEVSTFLPASVTYFPNPNFFQEDLEILFPSPHPTPTPAEMLLKGDLFPLAT